MKKIILAGDGWGAMSALNSLIKNFQKIFVLTNDSEIKKRFKGKVCFIDNFKSFTGETIILAGYKKIIPKTDLKKNTFINIHYSLLPKYRGFHSTVWAILNNEKYLGFTIHLVDQYIDNGDIIYQFKTKNKKNKTSRFYMEFFNKKVEEVLSTVITNYFLKKIKPKKQNLKKASWVTKRNIEDCRIDFNNNIKFLKNFFRALVSPYPLPFFTYNGNDYEVLECSFHKAKLNAKTGVVSNIMNKDVYIKVKDGYLILKKIRHKKTKKEIYAFQILNKIGSKI